MLKTVVMHNIFVETVIYGLSKVWSIILLLLLLIIKLSDSKDFYIVTNIAISNKCCSVKLSIHLWILKNKMHDSFNKNIVQLNCFQHW